MWNCRRPCTAKEIPRKKNKAGGTALHDFKHCNAPVIQTVWNWHHIGHTDQWNRIESPEVTQSTYDQLVFDKGARNTQWRKGSLFNERC